MTSSRSISITVTVSIRDRIEGTVTDQDTNTDFIHTVEQKDLPLAESMVSTLEDGIDLCKRTVLRKINKGGLA